MINKAITTDHIVPVELRLELYYRLQELIIEDSGNWWEMKEPFICLALPCMLWDLNNYRDDGPQRSGWCQIDTYRMFPEITRENTNEITNLNPEKDKEKIYRLRLKLLDDAINNATFIINTEKFKESEND